MSDFKVGDRVVHKSRQANDIGVIEKILGLTILSDGSRTMLYAVRFRVMRNWETSYTKKVVDALTNVVRIMVPRSGLHISAYDDFQAAINLLRDYHATQHVVYDQRDQARQQVKQLRELVDELRAYKNVLQTQNALLRDDRARFQANLDFWHGQASEFAQQIDHARETLKR